MSVFSDLSIAMRGNGLDFDEYDRYILDLVLCFVDLVNDGKNRNLLDLVRDVVRVMLFC